MLIVLGLVPAGVFAAPVALHYAGIAFLNNGGSTDALFPLTRALVKETTTDQKRSVLERALLEKVRAVRNPSFTLSEEMGDFRDEAQALSLAFAVDWENVAVEKIASRYKTVVDLHAVILIVDFTRLKVIGSFPVAIQLIDTRAAAPTDADKLKLLRDLYLTDQYDVNIFSEYARTLADVEVKRNYGGYIRVTQVKVEDKALPMLPDASPAGRSSFETFVANSFSKLLAKNQKVSFLPYSKGQAIGQKMSAVFANGDVYNLEIPPADFSVEIDVRGFKKVELGKNNIKSAWVYGSYINLGIYESLTRHAYLDQRFKYGVVKEMSAGTEYVDDWTLFQESLFTLFDQLTRQFSAPNRDWIEEAAGTSDVMPKLKTLNQKLASFR